MGTVARFRPVGLFRCLLLYAFTLAVAGGYGEAAMAAPRLQVLHTFAMLRGSHPRGVLVADRSGNLYGTTQQGGAANHGIVFELSPPAPGKRTWTETVLHVFNGADGDSPIAGLVLDGSGNLYGTTSGGGANDDGVVFELSPPAQGRTAWTEQLLHTFDGSSGAVPWAPLIADGAGNLYGTTAGGGIRGNGLVFELSPPKPGTNAWTETVLHRFNGPDGSGPEGGLVADGSGNFYGATGYGGAGGFGLVYELSPPAPGRSAWTETALYRFNSADGAYPVASLLRDAAGNLFGPASGGGPSDEGVIFELSPPHTGKTWTETVLYAFNRNNPNIPGVDPAGSLIADDAGDLYGTANQGGPFSAGDVFKLSPPSQGQTAWTATLLHAFQMSDGQAPYAGLLSDGAGNLYGVTQIGGANGDGVVFKVLP